MTTHTPGPWTVEPWVYRDGRDTVPTIRTETDAIAQLCNLWVPDDRAGEMAANARLIAAAPALLAALERIMAALPDGAVSVGMAAEILSARAALRAATGDPS